MYSSVNIYLLILCMDYQTLMQLFAVNYLAYCHHLNLNIAKHCRSIQSHHKINLSNSQVLYNWKRKRARNVGMYSIVHLCNAVNKPLTFFLDENFKIETEHQNSEDIK